MKIVFTLLVLSLISLSALAQDKPKIEVFGGYSYARLDTDEDYALTTGTAITTVRQDAGNLNGWNVALAANVNGWFGMVLDASGHYGSIGTTITNPAGAITRVHSDINVHTFLAGPQFYYRQDRYTVFGRALIGVVRLSDDFVGPDQTDYSIASGVGGGVDVKLTDHIWIRPIQADVIFTRFREFNSVGVLDRDTQSNLRLSGGVVLRAGDH